MITRLVENKFSWSERCYIQEKMLSFEDKELDETVVVRKFRTTTQHGAIEGKTQSRDVVHYNLDVIIALGYRVQLPFPGEE